jgi:ribosomal-protein-alanine N-acetyltransferase
MDHIYFPEKVETERLLLERLRYEDAEEIFYTYASKAAVTKFLSWKTHRTIDDTRNFLKYAIQNWNIGIDYSYSIRLKPTRQLIGSFGLTNDWGKIQFGYALSPTHWGNGYATETCRAMMKLAISDPAVFRVGTFVDAENVSSIRVLEKSGLALEAKLEKWFRFVNQGNQPKDCLLFILPLQRQ